MRFEFRKKFTQQLIKLPPDIQARFYERLNIFELNKFESVLNNHSVESAFPGCRSVNVTGDYRAIFYEEGGAAIFVTIGTRAQLYL